MAVACLLVPRFPLACELVERPDLRERPAVVTRPDGPLVWAASPAAERSGVVAGQRLREALVRCPLLAVIEARPARYQAVVEAILDALERVAPAVEPGPQGTAYADLRGLGGCYGSPEALAAALLGAAPRELGPRLGIAPSKFAALVAAHHAMPAETCVLNEEAVAPFLVRQPVELLQLPAETLRRLRLLGIETLGRLAALPRSAVAAQLGAEGGRAWDLARGEDREPLRPRPWHERVVERLAFAPPLASREAVLVAAEQALSRALRQPAVRGRAVRQVTLRVATERGGRWERTLTFREALCERARLWLVVKTALAEAQLPGMVSELELELSGLTAERGRQAALLSAHGRLQEQLEESLRQLKARYGHCPVGRVVEVEPWSRIPERRLALIDFDL